MWTLDTLRRRARVTLASTLLLFVTAAGLSTTQAAPLRGWAESAGLDALANRGAGVELGATDREQISELFARWGIAYDEGRTDLIADLFTQDALFQTLLAGSALPLADAHGRAAILENVGNSLKQQGDQRRHLISNVVIHPLDARHADVNAYGIVAVASDAISIGVTVFYRATAEKGGDGLWRFSRFMIGMDQYTGTPPRLPTAAH